MKSKTIRDLTIICIAAFLLALLAGVGAFVYFDNATQDTRKIDEKEDKETHYSTNEQGEQNVIEVEQVEGAYNILVLGYDNTMKKTDKNTGLTDVIMLVNIDLNKKSLTITQFPRDTYVSEDVPVHKINATYETYYLKEVANGTSDHDARLKATKQFADTLEKALGINIKYYAVMNLEGFGNIVDLLGGVEVDVPADLVYTDTAQDLYINLRKGVQLLDGDKAIQFVRYRSGYALADLGRGNAQKIFLASLLKKIKESNITTLMSVAAEAISNTSTNLTIEDLGFFARGVIGEIELSNMKMFTAPGEAYPPNIGTSYILQRNAIFDIIFNNYNTWGLTRSALESSFDPNHYFLDISQSDHTDIYYSTGEPAINYAYDAQKIIDESIHIPMT